jgi:hypothetical protein
MLARGGRDFQAAQHARHFFHAGLGVEHVDARGRLAIVQGAFCHLEMLIGLACHLRLVGHAQHLPPLPQAFQ